MKKTSKKALSILLIATIIAIGCLPVFAETIFTHAGFSYTQLNDNFASICGWDGGSEELVIPNMLNDSYVREIAGWTFNERDDFTSVNFDRADYLNMIGTMAFKNCTALNGQISIPPQIETIGISAFQQCSSVDTLYYHTSAAVPQQCFYLCTSLKQVVLDDGVTSIGRLAFAGCSSLEYIRIPSSVTEIHSLAFNNSPNVVIYCYTDSPAHSFAVDNGFDYVLLDYIAPTEPPTEAPTNIPTEAPTETPTDASTEAPTEVPTQSGYLLGDADGDDIVDTTDATAIQRHACHISLSIPAETLMHGDVDRDAELDVIDSTFIMRYSVLMNVPYPIGEWITP